MMEEGFTLLLNSISDSVDFGSVSYHFYCVNNACFPHWYHCVAADDDEEEAMHGESYERATSNIGRGNNDSFALSWLGVVVAQATAQSLIGVSRGPTAVSVAHPMKTCKTSL